MLGQTLVLLVFFGFVCTVFSDSAVLLVPLATAALPFSAMSNLFAVDEQSGWQAFELRAAHLARPGGGRPRAHRPGDHRGGARAGSAPPMRAPGSYLLPGAFGTAEEETVVVLTMGAAACAVTLLMLGTLLVVDARFGFTKAVRYLPFALVLVAFVGSYAVSALSKGGMEGWGSPRLTRGLLRWLRTRASWRAPWPRRCWAAWSRTACSALRPPGSIVPGSSSERPVGEGCRAGGRAWPECAPKPASRVRYRRQN